MTYGKKDIVEKIAETNGITKKAAAQAYDMVVAATKELVAQPDTKVSIKGLVTFESKIVPAHKRMLNFDIENPREVVVPERLHTKASASKHIGG